MELYSAIPSFVDKFQFLVQDNLTLIGKSKNYFRDLLKLMRLLAFILFYIGLILRFVYADSEEKFVVAR